MILKKDLIVAVLATFCLTAILFTAIPIRSTPSPSEYDPWIDTNDDGIINYEDLFNLASRYGTFGTPINKTDLLLELQSKVDSLNASILDLEARVNALEEPVTTERIADAAVTNAKLAAGAIPFNSTYSTTPQSTTSMDWPDMPDMSVSITLATKSHVIIMFSSRAWLATTGNFIRVRAKVGPSDAYPGSAGIPLTDQTSMWWSYSYVFYLPNVNAGVYTVRIQWRVATSASAGNVAERTLSVIALPG